MLQYPHFPHPSKKFQKKFYRTFWRRKKSEVILEIALVGVDPPSYPWWYLPFVYYSFVQNIHSVQVTKKPESVQVFCYSQKIIPVGKVYNIFFQVWNFDRFFSKSLASSSPNKKYTKIVRILQLFGFFFFENYDFEKFFPTLSMYEFSEKPVKFETFLILCIFWESLDALIRLHLYQQLGIPNNFTIISFALYARVFYRRTSKYFNVNFSIFFSENFF